MKKRVLLCLMVAVISALLLTACKTAANLKNYDVNYQSEFHSTVEIDDYITLDGKLDESVWTDSKNAYTIVSKLEDGGHMETKVYLGEKAFYFAFDVKDNSLFYNSARGRSANTSVELYFCSLNTYLFDQSCYSLRFNPASDDGTISCAILGYGASWREIQSTDYDAKATIDGKLNDGTGNDEGYTIECAVSYKFLGDRRDGLRYSMQYCESRAYSASVAAAAKNHIPGWNYLRPATWLAATNDGLIDAVTAADEMAVADEDFDIDGKLDESAWTDAIGNGKGKSMTYIGSNARINGAKFDIYTALTDKGAYIGVDSTARYVYVSDDRPVKYDSGIQLFVAMTGVSGYKTGPVKQIRASASGRTERYDAYPATSALWQKGVFPMLSAGSVKGGTFNTSSAEGWQIEMFIPWESLGVQRASQKKQISILPMGIYHSENVTATDGNTSGTTTVIPVDSGLYKEKSIDIDRTYLTFTKDDGFVYNGISGTVNDVDITNTAVKGGKDCYFTDVRIKYVDCVTSAQFETDFPTDVVKTIKKADGTDLAFDNMGDGIYRLYVEQSSLESLDGDGLEIEVTDKKYGITEGFALTYDNNCVIDGIVNASDTAISDVITAGKTLVVSSNIGETNFTMENACAIVGDTIYLTAIVTDKDVRPINSGVSFYMASGNPYTVGKAIRIHVRVDGTVSCYTFRSGAWGLSEFDQLKAVVGETADGYVVECRLPLSALSEEDITEYRMLPTLTISSNPKKDNIKTMLGNAIFTEDYAADFDAYMRFDRDGFAPDMLYALDSVTFTHGKNLIGSDAVGYEGESIVPVSFLKVGGLTTDEKLTLTLNTEAGEVLPNTTEVTSGGFAASVQLKYAKPVLADFDKSKVKAFINFDYGASNLVADGYTDYMEQVDGTTIAVNPNEKDYEGDKSFNSNMRRRWMRMPYEIGNKSFTVSMTLNCDGLNAWPTSNYSYILFGTGNVDNVTEGFTVRMRSEFWQIRILDQTYTSTAGLHKLTGFKRVTVSVERTGLGTNFYLWLEDELLFTQSTDYVGTLDIPGSGKLGFGGPGSYKDTETGYPNVTINMDDVLLFEDVVTSPKGIYDMIAYIDDMNAKAHFSASVSEIRNSFADFVAADEKETTFSITKGIELIDRGVTFTGEWSDSVVNNGDGTYTFTMTNADAANYTTQRSCGYVIDGVTKYVLVSYVPLHSITAEEAEVGYWRSDEQDGKYPVTLVIKGDGDIAVSNMGVSITSETSGLIHSVTEKGNGEYLVQLNKAVADGADSHVLNVTCGSGVIGCSVTVKATALTATEISEIIGSVVAYLNFDGTNGISNLKGGQTAMVYDTNTADNNGIKIRNGSDMYFEADTKNNTLGLKGISLGTEDFTISFDVMLDRTSFVGCAAHQYELISSTYNFNTTYNDNHTRPKSNFVVSLNGTSTVESPRIQLGRNDGKGPKTITGVNRTNGLINLGGWMRYTIVVDRNVATINKTNSHNKYGADGEAIVLTGSSAAAYSLTEEAKLYFYVNGKLIETHTVEMSGQPLGYDDMLYVGGHYGNTYNGAGCKSGIDNLVVCKRALTGRQVAGLSDVYSRLSN